ncbi:MAG TPA: MBL fold metallo-hydrolase, partial [Rhodobiaceae bacterium]|nr:MBL fold metallo-hydrolase [Rhodobiaceae bacterium]
MELIQIYDPGVAQYAYILGCENTGEAIIIDPQRNISEYLKAAEDKNLNIVAVTETHIHADFLSGTQEFVKTLGMKAYCSKHGEGQGWAYEWA